MKRSGASKHPFVRPGGGVSGTVRLSKSNSLAPTRRRARIWTTIALMSLFVIVTGSLYLSYSVAMQNGKPSQSVDPDDASGRRPTAATDEGAANGRNTKGNASSPTDDGGGGCAFRSYPSNRLYGLSSKTQPKFLSQAAYIRGRLPTILNPIENDGKMLPGGKGSIQTPPAKVCIDTTSWENLIDESGKKRLPFSDGQNPSVVSLAPDPYSVSDAVDDHRSHARLDPKHIEAIASALPGRDATDVGSLFLGITIFGSGQCKFGLSPEDVESYGFSAREEPQGGKRAVVAVLAPPTNDGDSSFRTLAQTTLMLERDAKYGTSPRRAVHPESAGSGFARITQEFDDPRFFFHEGRVWILYRNGPLFGYETQVHNPVHFERADAGGAGFAAYVKASESIWVGGGRNIALISEEPLGRNEDGEAEWAPNPSLKTLTWVDPVTVREDVKFGRVKNRRLLEAGDASGDGGDQNSSARSLFSEHRHDKQRHRRLGSKPTKSNVHGTNGYMVPLPSTGELLGIAHFHRPENRKKSEFALHGHHYTHAFFTIARGVGDATKDVGSRPFKLKRLSNEFVFRANFVLAGETQPPRDGDVIQFASGIDLVGSDVDGRLIISYGINDCEGSVFSYAMEMVQAMLLEVEPGQEVVDLMENA